MKTSLIAIGTFVFGGIVAIFLFGQQPHVVSSLGGIQTNTVKAGSNYYTSQTASTTAQKLLSSRSGRVGLRLSNTGLNAVRIFLQSTSTGATATSGVSIAAAGTYTPEFSWEGEVWEITASATSTIEAQETTP
jgi:hypothetical protein